MNEEGGGRGGEGKKRRRRYDEKYKRGRKKTYKDENTLKNM